MLEITTGHRIKTSLLALAVLALSYPVTARGSETKNDEVALVKEDFLAIQRQHADCLMKAQASLTELSENSTEEERKNASERFMFLMQSGNGQLILEKFEKFYGSYETCLDTLPEPGKPLVARLRNDLISMGRGSANITAAVLVELKKENTYDISDVLGKVLTKETCDKTGYNPGATHSFIREIDSLAKKYVGDDFARSFKINPPSIENTWK